MAILSYCGRALQALMLLSLVVALTKIGSNPYLAGQLTGRIVFSLLMTEFLIRSSQPKQNDSPSGCNFLAGGCLSIMILGGLAGFVFGIKAAMGPGRPPLVSHSGPNKVFTLKVPKGSKFTKQSRTDALPEGRGSVKVNAEVWELGDEGGLAGVADIPLIRTAAASQYASTSGRYTSYGRNQGLGRAMNDNEIIDVVCDGQLQAMGAEPGSKRDVNRLGYKGKEVDFTSTKVQGRVLYMWGNRRLFFCIYGTSPNHWDEARAQAVINSFRFSAR